MENKTAIYLDKKEVELFKKFRQYQDDFECLLEAGFFNFKNGCAFSYRDPKGILQDIKIETTTFKRRKKKNTLDKVV